MRFNPFDFKKIKFHHATTFSPSKQSTCGKFRRCFANSDLVYILNYQSNQAIRDRGYKFFSTRTFFNPGGVRASSAKDTRYARSHSSPSPYPTFTISLAERILMQIVGSEPEAVVIYRELSEGHAICSKPFLAFAISQLCHIPRGENFDADCWF